MNNFKAKYFGEGEKPRIEIIPMIDVMMFLLVFFVLIMFEMLQNAGVPIDVPSSASAERLETTKIEIGVNQDGQMILDGKGASEQQVMQIIFREKEKKQVSALIMGDKNTSYQNIIKVMDVVRAAGVNNIGLVTKE